MNNTSRLLFCLAALALMLTFSADAAPKGNAANPDLTKGESIPEGYTHDWNLGATGARGWMYPEKLTTTTARDSSGETLTCSR